MWVTPPEMKQSSSSFTSVLKFAALCVIVTLAVLFLQEKRGGGGSVDYECTEVGRFPDPNNPYNNCFRSYVLCISGDSDSWKSYTCPLGTQFSALEGRCVNDVDNFSECRNYDDHKELTEIISEKITSSFQCAEEGVFRNSDSMTCMGYFICVNTQKSDLYAIYSNCEENQFFSAELSACINKDSSHFCDEGLLLQISQPIVALQTSSSSLQESSPTTTEMTTMAITTIASTTQATTTIVATTPTTTTPTSTIQTTTTLAATTQTTTPIWTTTMATTTPKITTTITTTSIKPPPPHPILSTTSTTSNKESGENSDSNELEFTPPPSLKPIYPEAIPNLFFTCPEEGRFESPFETTTDCSYYILCCYVSSNDLQAYLFKCPGDTIFSPIQGRCTFGSIKSCQEFKNPLEVVTQITQLMETTTAAMETTTKKIMVAASPVTTTKAPEEKTTSTTIKPEVTDNPFGDRCPAVGRFHNEYTLNCKSYLLCPRIGSTGYYFRCPEGSTFSDMMGRCVKDYDCPYFSCTKPGRFPYIKDKEKYVLCIKAKGRIIAHRMKCSKDMVFSNIQRRCLPEKLVKIIAW